MIRRPPRSTLFPTRRSSDLLTLGGDADLLDVARAFEAHVAGDTLAVEVVYDGDEAAGEPARIEDRKSTRLNSSHANISYAVFCLKKKTDSSPGNRSEYTTTA